MTPRVMVAIASAGRPDLLKAVTANLDRQTAEGLIRVVSVPDEGSLPSELSPAWRSLTGPKGLATQRNTALDVVDVDFVFFFDDDAVIREDFIANALAFFEAHPEVVGMTGRVLLDGAVTGEIAVEKATSALAASTATAIEGRWEPTRELYGCNFGFRTAASTDLRFDQRLPLYSWLEDHDFARRLLSRGPLARVDDCVIVHRAATSGGRQSHVRLGYSQVMNPIYLWKKGSFPGWLAFREIFRPAAKNVAFSVVGSQSAWRRQRLKGNAVAMTDVLRSRITPERITEL
jgi:GT2 family glycosyltransferase